MPRTDLVQEQDPREWLKGPKAERGPALRLYDHLEKVGGIKQLKSMPHLGAVAWVCPEVKHTRWDYVEVMLRLVAAAVPVEKDLGRFGEVEIEGHEIGAGRELLQCWAMLLNYGHLWGTFATERLVLEALTKSDNAKRLFLAGMQPGADRAFAERVLDNYLIYDLNIAIAAGFLNTLPAARGSEHCDMWLSMLRAYRSPEQCGHKVARLRRVYRRIRRLAFLYLDLAYAHLPVELDISAVENDPRRYIGSLLARDSGPLQSLLDNINRYVRPEIYLEPAVVLAHRLLQDQCGPMVLEELDGAESAPDLFASLQAMRTRDAWRAVAGAIAATKREDYVHFHRVRRARHKKVTPDAFSAQVPRLQCELHRAAGAETLVHVAVGGDLHEQFIDFFAQKDIRRSALARTLTGVCRAMPARLCTGVEVRDLATSLLSLMLGTKQRVRVKEYAELGGDESFVLLPKEKSGSLYSRFIALRRASAEPPRMHEISVLEDCVGRTPQEEFRIVMFGGFEVVGATEDSPGCAEFDGAYIDVSENDVALHIVEAKHFRDSAEGSRQAICKLRKRLRDLGWAEGASIEAIPGGAEAVIPVSLHRVSPSA